MSQGLQQTRYTQQELQWHKGYLPQRMEAGVIMQYKCPWSGEDKIPTVGKWEMIGVWHGDDELEERRGTLPRIHS